MTTIKWPRLPSGTSNVGLGAGDVRYLKRQLQTGLEARGQFQNVNSPVQQGAAKLATSTTTFIYDDSKATTVWQYENLPVLRSDTSRMYSYVSYAVLPPGTNSKVSYLVATPGFAEHATDYGETITWVERSDTTGIATEGLYTTSFGTTYDGVPTVYTTVSYAAAPVTLAAQNVWISAVTSGGFTYRVSDVLASAMTLTWVSLGTMTRGI